MTIQQRIEEDLKIAMKARDELRLATLRLVRSAFKNKQIETGKDLSDQDAVAVMRTMLKQYKDALNDFTVAGRTDLAERQTKEIEVIEGYLPQQMSEAQVEETCKIVIGEMNATVSDAGKVMGAVMKRLAGQADGALVKQVVERLLKG
ncbi:MAG: GatB/YqeY domain-containing protein [Patescibacteria group bacterium]|nr:GatB/YqeY domain-containing protein [Patescibacteria group bacterium]